jgi:hypothetical protein
LEELDALLLVAGAEEAADETLLVAADEVDAAELLTGVETAEEAAELLVDLVLGMYLETDFLVEDALEVVAGAEETEVVFTGALETVELAFDEDAEEAAEVLVDLVLGMYLETDFLVEDALLLVAGADEAVEVFTGALETGVEATDFVDEEEDEAAELVAGLLAEEAVGLLEEVVFLVGG